MKFAMHNWMRQEPIETTIERLHRLGYDGIEISGEPTQYDTSQVARLLEKYRLACWGSHSIMMPGRDLVSEEASVRGRNGASTCRPACAWFMSLAGRFS